MVLRDKYVLILLAPVERCGPRESGVSARPGQRPGGSDEHVKLKRPLLLLQEKGNLDSLM
jgi:hypothetical protein